MRVSDDPELKLYGGEEMEMGFKVWQCGGRIVLVRCSHVGHVFRDPGHWQGQVYKVPMEVVSRGRPEPEPEPELAQIDRIARLITRLDRSSATSCASRRRGWTSTRSFTATPWARAALASRRSGSETSRCREESENDCSARVTPGVSVGQSEG